jgi:hypothetical protein
MAKGAVKNNLELDITSISLIGPHFNFWTQNETADNGRWKQ